MKTRQGSLRDDLRRMKITRGALVVLVLEVVGSLLWIFADNDLKRILRDWVIATPANVFEHGRVWTLLTTAFVELDFIQLILAILVLWMFVPTLEKFWGTNRFYRFVAVTSVAGALGGCLVGLALGDTSGPHAAISGLSPFVYASIVAFGILYAKQPVQFSFYIQMTGRQLMWGFIVFLVLFVTIQQAWEKGGSFAAAMVAAAVITSKKWSPALAWRRWRIARARAHLSVLEGGKPREPKRDKQRYLN